MPNLHKKLTLNDFQKYVTNLEEKRGFADATVLQQCLKLGEEVGELFKAIRKKEKLKLDSKKEVLDSVDEELADIFIYLCSIANRYDIDLERAFREKEEKNKTRTWQ